MSQTLPDSPPDTGAYCKARQRIPDALLPRLTCESADRIETRASKDWLFHDRRVVICRLSPPAATDLDGAPDREPEPESRSRPERFVHAVVKPELTRVSLSRSGL